MKKALVIVVLVSMVGLAGCASSITSLNDRYTESSVALKQFAKITAQDWLFGSGIIQGALQEPMLPAWVFTELQKVDSWFIEGKDLTDWEMGYIVGVRLRLAAPVIRAAIEQYAPGILAYTEVGAVLAFIGL
jgi:hypothetical protein